jgi:hypothetical protein
MKRACPRTGRVCMPGCTECRPTGQHGTRNPARNLTDHVRWARALKRRTPYCQHCGRTDKLDAHHQPDGTGVVLCNACHCTIDPYARPR